MYKILENKIIKILCINFPIINRHNVCYVIVRILHM